MVWVYAGTGLVWTTWTAAISVGAIIGHHTRVDSGGQLFLLSGEDPAAGWWNAALSLFILLVVVGSGGVAGGPGGQLAALVG